MNTKLKISISIIMLLISLTAFTFIILVTFDVIKLSFSVFDIDKIGNFSGSAMFYLLRCSLYLSSYSLVSLLFVMLYIWLDHDSLIPVILSIVFIISFVIALAITDFINNKMSTLDIISAILGYLVYIAFLCLYVTVPPFLIMTIDDDEIITNIIAVSSAFVSVFILSFIFLFIYFVLTLIMNKIFLFIIVIIIIIFLWKLLKDLPYWRYY